jgi:hypothetical protein
MERKATFRDVLTCVALRNALALECKAHTASSLATAYPESEGAFRKIESAAIEQILRILVCVPRNSETQPARESISEQAKLVLAQMATA